MNRNEPLIPICFCCTHPYIQHLIVAITSILENNPKHLFRFYILHSDWEEQHKQQIYPIKKRYDNCDFIFHQIPLNIFKGFKITDPHRADIHLSTYYRYMAPELITEHDKLIYLDCDTVVLGDLLPLYQTEIDNYYFAGVEERCLYENGYVADTLKFSKHEVYINAGVLLMNSKALRKNHFFQQFLHKGKELLPHIQYSDQDILNILARGKIKQIDCIYNMTRAHIQDLPIKKYETVIAHYTGKYKPWTMEDLSYEMGFYYLKYLNKSIVHPKVKNFCVYHKPSFRFENDLVTPIQTGTYGNNCAMDMLQASTGDSIDYKNKNYGELTAWYWVYKNYLPAHPGLEYVGFCHYRRMLDYTRPPVKEGFFLTDIFRSYFIDELHSNYRAAKVYQIIKDYDIVLPKKHILGPGETNETQYLEFHPKKDLDLLKQIIKEEYPDYVPAMNEFWSANTGYYCLLFTMKKEIFVSFMEFTFNILSKLEKRSDWSHYTAYDETRIPAFLIERFFNVWLLHNAKQKKWKILERHAYIIRDYCNLTPNKTKKPSIVKIYYKYVKYRFLSHLYPGKKHKKYVTKKHYYKNLIHLAENAIKEK